MCNCKEKNPPASNALYDQSLSIPPDIRPDLVKVIDRTRQAVRFTAPDVAYMGEVWNRYIAPAREPEDMNCAGCRTKVIGKLRRMVDLWKEYEVL